MPEYVLSAGAVLEALGFASFVRDHSGALRLEGAAPQWLRSIWPELETEGARLPIEKASPFLENFLVDASTCWEAGGEARSRSGPWIEQTDNGTEVTLEAVALNAGNHAVLVLERLGEVFEAKKSMLQKARETIIAYQRLNSEMQKKEILLSCIADEMNTALANTITSLRLMELEQNPARIQQLLGLASRATEEQQALINKVLHVFADELEELYGHNGSGQATAKLDGAVRAAKENVTPLFAEKRVYLSLGEGSASNATVSMDADHLARVLSNLLENALQNSTPGGEVQLVVFEEPESVVINVLDQGASLTRDVYRNLFSKVGKIDASSLKLQFCRVAVENCGGETGGGPRTHGGNCFWIRLRKSSK
jgi:signal transduction histidine kinase